MFWFLLHLFEGYAVAPSQLDQSCKIKAMRNVLTALAFVSLWVVKVALERFGYIVAAYGKQIPVSTRKWASAFRSL